MWIPATAAEILKAIAENAFEENAQLDYKRSLPTRGRGADLATDVAAMANDGGVLVYGVDEDENKRPSSAVPVAGLRVAAERVDQIVQHSVAGAPAIRIHLRPIEPGGDTGFLVVEVPPSPEAPHMVRSTHRFHGRGATSNRALEQEEVDRLYARRARWQVDREAMLHTALETWPAAERAWPGTLIVVARPAVGEASMLDRARESREGDRLGPQAALSPMLQHAQEQAWNREWSPSLGQLRQWENAPGDGFRASTHARDEEIDPTKLIVLRVDGNCGVHLLCGRGTLEARDSGRLLVAEGLIATLASQAFSFSGALLRACGYAGPVDVGLHIGGLRGAISAAWLGRLGPGIHDGAPYSEDEYRATRRVWAGILSESPIVIASGLVRPLSRVTAGEGFDPVGTVRP